MKRGYVVYEGKSMFNKQPIVGIVTMTSSNEKTGNMAQLWILNKDMSPMEAVNNHEDVSICGGCKHRHNLGGACYVLPFQGPTSVYKSYKAGKYSNDIEDLQLMISNRGIRLGAYGDPAMLPESVLSLLTESARFHTGYTHQWKNKRLAHAVKYCQGSVDTSDEYKTFKMMYPYGFTFRVTEDDSEALSDEVECLADSQGLSCIECKMCDGSKKDISIVVHGAKKNRYINQIKIKEVSV